MKSGVMLCATLFASVVATIVGTLYKIQKVSFGESLLWAAILLYLLFLVIAIYEIIRSKQIDKSEKTLWILALIFFSSVTGLIYLLIGRKKIVPKISNAHV